MMPTRPNYYLITSSGFFIIPALYGVYTGHHWLPLLSVVSGAVSISYWIRPSKNNALLLTDQIVSRMSGVVYTLYGLSTIDNVQMKIIFWLDIAAMLVTYYTSCRLYYGPYHHVWIPYHMMFHYFYIILQLLVL